MKDDSKKVTIDLEFVAEAYGISLSEIQRVKRIIQKGMFLEIEGENVTIDMDKIDAWIYINGLTVLSEEYIRKYIGQREFNKKKEMMELLENEDVMDFVNDYIKNTIANNADDDEGGEENE